MPLWKVELFKMGDDNAPVRWGVVHAPTQESAESIVRNNMGDHLKAEALQISINELLGLPEGTFFWTES